MKQEIIAWVDYDCHLAYTFIGPQEGGCNGKTFEISWDR